MSSFPSTLRTATPEDGFALAIKLSRLAVKATQADPAVRERLRPNYAESAEGLIAASAVVAAHFRTIAAANDYWRSS